MVTIIKCFTLKVSIINLTKFKFDFSGKKLNELW